MVPDLDQDLRAKRPIIEFRPNLKLYDSGVQAKAPVTVIDFINTDALSQVNGALNYVIDGVSLTTGTRIIFAADTDLQVRNKIYEVEFISPDTVAPLISQPVIHLVEASDAQVLRDQTVVVLSGLTEQGLTYRFDGTNWVVAQQKTSINQEPLFDIFDNDGVSLSDQTLYPSSTFVGTKLFSYARGTGTDDTVLGFPLTYLSLANVGDILFNNNLYKDTFLYVNDNVSVSRPISLGKVRQFTELLFYQELIGWQPAATPSFQHQQLRFIYDGEPLILDVRAALDDIIPSIKVFNGSSFVDSTQYTVERGSDRTTINFVTSPAIGDVIEVQVISDQISQVGFYEIPHNLESNPFNVDSERFTLGTIRRHYGSIGENLINLSGDINGDNNIRDLGNIIPYGTDILQQSSPMTLMGYFLRQQNYDIVRALQFNNDQYIKFKNQMFDLITNQDYTNYTVPEVLDDVLVELAKGRTSVDAFYWSDMIPVGTVYQSQRIIYTSISSPTFDLTQTYDFTSSNYRAVLVYVNDVLLVKDQDYVVSVDGPRLTVTATLVAGDVIEIREYSATYGNFVPNTPSKMGLYPAWKPEIYLDESYVSQ